jgi:hypothetical protein
MELSVADIAPSHRAGVVYWFCPPRSAERHATNRRPGSLINGGAIRVLCGAAVTVPLATPNDRVPRSKSVKARCGNCESVTRDLDARDVTWDF